MSDRLLSPQYFTTVRGELGKRRISVRPPDSHVLSAKTMRHGSIHITTAEAGRLKIGLPYRSDRILKIKSVKGRRWHAEEKHWTVPHAKDAVTHLLALFEGEPMEVDPVLDGPSVPRQDRRVPDTSSALLDRLGTELRARHCARRTEQAYGHWLDGLPAFIMVVSLPRWRKRRLIGF